MSIPWRVREALRPVQFAVAARLVDANRPSTGLLKSLRAGWSNEGWSGDVRFLRAVWERALRARRILECGSGLSTVLLGMVIRQTRGELWSLEHLPQWRDRVNAVLSKYELPNRVSLASLVSYGSFDWYQLPADLPSDFDLVICDGPPAESRGGRFGLVPVCRDRIAGATILLDDAERTDEIGVIEAWRAHAAFASRIVAARAGSYAVLSMSGRQSCGSCAGSANKCRMASRSVS